MLGVPALQEAVLDHDEGMGWRRGHDDCTGDFWALLLPASFHMRPLAGWQWAEEPLVAGTARGAVARLAAVADHTSTSVAGLDPQMVHAALSGAWSVSVLGHPVSSLLVKWSRRVVALVVPSTSPGPGRLPLTGP